MKADLTLQFRAKSPPITSQLSYRAAHETSGAALCVVLGLVLSMSCQSSKSTVSGQNGFVADNLVVSLGNIEAGRVYEHTFKLRNTGANGATITRLRPSCGVVADLLSSQRTVAPNHNASILVKLDARTISGPFSRGVTVMTDASQGPDIQLLLEGTVIKPVNVVPSPIDLGLVPRKGKKITEGKIDIPTSVSHNLESVSVADERFSVALREDRTDRAWTFELNFKGSSTPVPILTNMIIRLKAEPTPLEVLIPVRVEVYGDLRYARDVYLVQNSDGTPTPRDVPVTTRSGRSFELLTAKDPDGRVTVKILEPHGSPAVLRLLANSPADGKKQEGHVLFETDVRGEKKKTIHYVIPASARDY